MQRNAAPGWMMLPSRIFRAGGGLVTGAFLGYMATRFLQSGSWTLLGPLAGGAIGLVAGLVSGKRAERRAAARRDDLAANASRVGARFSEYDVEVQQALQSDFPQQHAFIRNVLRKELVDLRVAVGDLSITRMAHRNGESDTSSRKTAAYYRRDDLAFPGFSLEPAGLVHKLVSAAVGLQGLRFPEHPQFERQYFVVATDANATRALLDAQVQAWLVAHPGWNLDAGGHGVLAYRGDAMLPPEALHGFIADAAELFRLLARSSRD